MRGYEIPIFGLVLDMVIKVPLIRTAVPNRAIRSMVENGYLVQECAKRRGVA
jgi:hypothetical protein